MKELLFRVLELSLSGSVVILVVMALRLVLRKTPRRIFCLLWLLAGLRLMVPFEIESSLSLQPEFSPVTQEEAQWEDTPPVTASPQLGDSGDTTYFPIYTPETIVAANVPEASEAAELPEKTADAVPAAVDYAAAVSWLWAAGALGLLLYSLFSYIRLKGRVNRAVILQEGIWVCGDIETAFVLGFFRPQIYLPAGLSPEEQRLILAHERMHVARLDHWSKALGFGVLAAHWFNPLVWAAFVLLCRDIEMACDEAVVKTMTVQERKSYSAALLRCSDPTYRIAACPVAFGEVSVKTRIWNVLNYRKKGFWVILAALMAVLAVSVCFLTSPAEGGKPFATVSEPWAWVQGIHKDAVKSAVVYIQSSKSYSTEGHSVTCSRNEYTAEQLDPLFSILNEIPKGAFGPEEKLERTSLGFYEQTSHSYQGVSVTIIDEVNGLAALLRLHHGDTVDLILTDEVEKVEADTANVDNLYCWTIQSMELKEYLQSLIDQPPVISADQTAAVEETSSALLQDEQPQDEMIWAQNLKTEDVAYIDLVAYPAAIDKRYQRFEGDEINTIVQLINGSGGRCVVAHLGHSGGELMLYVSMKDGSRHRVGREGNEYLTIDGKCFLSDRSWLDSWPDEGNSPMSDGFVDDNEKEVVQNGLQTLRDLSAEEVSTVEMVVTHTNADRAYQRFEGAEAKELVKLLNGAGAKENQPGRNNGDIWVALYITRKDGTWLKVVNVGDINLEIGGETIEADSDWLKAWPHYGTSSVPEDFYERFPETEPARQPTAESGPFELTEEKQALLDMAVAAVAEFHARECTHVVLHDYSYADEEYTLWRSGEDYAQKHSAPYTLPGSETEIENDDWQVQKDGVRYYTFGTNGETVWTRSYEEGWYLYGDIQRISLDGIADVYSHARGDKTVISLIDPPTNAEDDSLYSQYDIILDGEGRLVGMAYEWMAFQENGEVDYRHSGIYEVQDTADEEIRALIDKVYNEAAE